MLSSAVYSGMATHITTTEKNSEIFMSADETFMIITKRESRVLRRVCMEVPVESNKTQWDLVKGDCNVQSTTVKQHVIGNVTTAHIGYLFYLLEGSTISIQLQARSGKGSVRIYVAKNNSEVNKLEQKCMDGELKQAFLNCSVEPAGECGIECQTAAHYYICFPNTSTLNFTIALSKVQHNISEYEACNNEKSAPTHRCCKLSLNPAECVFISATCEEASCLHSPVNVITLTVLGNHVTGSLAAGTIILLVGLVGVVSTCALVYCKVHHCFRGLQFNL